MDSYELGEFSDQSGSVFPVFTGGVGTTVGRLFVGVLHFLVFMLIMTLNYVKCGVCRSALTTI